MTRSSVSKRRQIKLSVFMMMDGNYSLGGWRREDAYADAGQNIARWQEFARVLERGKIDMLFIADNISPQGVHDVDAMSQTAQAIGFEPFTLLAALASVTSRLGLAATANTTWNEPYIVARMFASLDHLSGGRAGWNMVTGRNADDAPNFSRDEHMPYEDRYARAIEFIDIVRGLWDSFEDDAVLYDKKGGRFFAPQKMHFLRHNGAHFSVRGPLSVSRPLQGHPVLIQAGQSEQGRNLSAQVADAVFTSQATVEAARRFYSDIKNRTENAGRRPHHVKILPGVSFYVGRSREEAAEKYEHTQSLIPISYAVRQLGLRLGNIDLSSYPLDGPLPELPKTVMRADPGAYFQFAGSESLTLRQAALRAAAAKSHRMLIGTAKDIADQLEDWFVSEAADGYNLLPPYVPGSLVDFVDLVVPELQRRGLFRYDYEGQTLRENLELPRPENVFAACPGTTAPASA